MGTPRQIFSQITAFQLKQNFKKTQKELIDLLESDDDGCLRCNTLRCRCTVIKPGVTEPLASISLMRPSAYGSKTQCTEAVPIAPSTNALPMPLWCDQMVPSVSILDAKDYPGKELRMHTSTPNPNAPYPQIKTIPQPPRRTTDTPRTVKRKLHYSGALSGIQRSHNCWQQYQHYGLCLGNSIPPQTSHTNGAIHTVSYRGDDELIIDDLREVKTSSHVPWSSSGYDSKASSGISKEAVPTAREEAGCAFGAIGDHVTVTSVQDTVENFFQSFRQDRSSPVVVANGQYLYPAQAATSVTYTTQLPPSPPQPPHGSPSNGYYQCGVFN